MFVIFPEPDLFETADDIAFYQGLLFDLLLSPCHVLKAQTLFIGFRTRESYRFENCPILHANESLRGGTDPCSMIGRMNYRDKSVRMVFAELLKNADDIEGFW
jgi:hypothetical protein